MFLWIYLIINFKKKLKEVNVTQCDHWTQVINTWMISCLNIGN